MKKSRGEFGERFEQAKGFHKIPRRLFLLLKDSEPDRAILQKKVTPAIQHGRRDVVSNTKRSHSFQVSKVLRKNTENEKDTILGIRNDRIWKNGMGMPTAFTENSGNRDLLIYSLSMNDINNRTGIGSMDLTVSFGMTDGTHLGFRIKRAHKIKK